MLNKLITTIFIISYLIHHHNRFITVIIYWFIKRYRINNCIQRKYNFFPWQSHFPGKFVNADLDKASLENERNAVIIRMENGQMVTCVQVAGLVARRILCYVKQGDRLQRGQRFGFIRFGSRVDVFLPLGTEVLVKLGQTTTGDQTVIAKLK